MRFRHCLYAALMPAHPNSSRFFIPFGCSFIGVHSVVEGTSAWLISDFSFSPFSCSRLWRATSAFARGCEVLMSFDLLLGGVTAACVLGYLVVVLLRPENF
jgi:hypothetical protein